MSEPDLRELVANLKKVMKEAGEWACLVGPQKAGKSTYAQFLLNCPTLGEPHAWTLGSLMKEASGKLRIAEVVPAAALPCLDARALADDRTVWSPSITRTFYQAEPTKDILHFQAFRESSSRRRPEATGRLPVHFFDLPGEWPRSGDGEHRPRAPWQLEPVQLLLSRTERFVFFVPFWALLPTRWVEAQRHAIAAEPATWGTSMAASDPQDPSRISAEGIARAAAMASRDVQLWVDQILEHRRKGFDLLLVINQFQEQPVRRLLNLFETGLGDRVWEAYAQVFARPPRSDGDAWRDLRQRLHELREIGVWLLRAFDRDGGREGGRDGSSVALEALDRLVKFQRHADSMRAEGERRRARTVTILPLNVVELDPQKRTTYRGQVTSTYDLFAAPPGGDTPELRDFRLCADVVWWIMLQIKADRIWMA